MRIIEVQTAQHKRLFLTVPVSLHQKNPAWIRPLDKDIEGIFDQTKNKAFRNGTCIRWLLLDSDHQPIGRIAAFVNKKYRNKGDDLPVGGIGFFECIDLQEAATLLFDTAKAWLTANGMEAMDGPINFGERDKWWGLVTKGFQQPLYCMNYNPPYYIELFENYGFQTFYKQLCFGMHPRDPLLPKFFERHAAITKDPNFSAQHLKKAELKKFAQDFCTVYNKAWAGHAGNKELPLPHCIKLFEQMKPVMDEKIIWFAYYKNDPIAIFINLPDLNQWFKYLNGQFNLFAKLKFLWKKATTPNKRFVGLVFGVVPEWQARGVDSYLIVEAAKIIQVQLSYEEYEMQWIGDFNPKMIAVAESLTELRSRELTTFRYNFDRSLPFRRHPIV